MFCHDGDNDGNNDGNNRHNTSKSNVALLSVHPYTRALSKLIYTIGKKNYLCGN